LSEFVLDKETEMKKNEISKVKKVKVLVNHGCFGGNLG